MVIFEDDDLIVVNKPPFVASLDNLDKDTSGILLIAKNPETYRLVSIEFEHRRVEKAYHAVIAGTHMFDSLRVDLPILNLGNKNVTIDRRNGKPAETVFHSIQHFRHFTLVECRPITGRMHQIRIHLATQHAAIVGDTLYKGKPVYLSQIKKRGFTMGKGQEEQPITRRFALHARSLALRIGGKDYAFEAPYPKDFATLLKILHKFDS